MVVEHRLAAVLPDQPIEDVRVVYLEPRRRANGYRLVQASLIRFVRELARRRHEIDGAQTHPQSTPGELPDRVGSEDDSGVIQDKPLVCGQSLEVLRTQGFAPRAHHRGHVGVPPEGEHRIRTVGVLQSDAVVVVDAFRGQFRPPAQQPALLGPEVKVVVLLQTAKIRARQKARLRPEPGADVLVQRGGLESPPASGEHRLVIGSKQVCRLLLGGADHALNPRGPVPAEAKAGDQAAHAVERTEELPAGEDHTKARLCADVVGHLRDKEVRLFSTEWVIVFHDLTGRLVVSCQGPDRPGTELPGQPYAVLRVADPPREHQGCELVLSLAA